MHKLPLVPPMDDNIFTALSPSGIKCGTKTCGVYEFCSKYHSDCESCAPICDEMSHNFDRQTCITDCQSELSNYIAVFFLYTK